jgi:hypothetical protein
MIKRILAAIGSWLRGTARNGRVERPDVTRVLIRIPRSVMHSLRRATSPTKDQHEPLAFVRVRYASESMNGVVVALGVIPFVNDAYVQGYAGANFDTGWAVAVANREIASNCGILLAHQHGGRGAPTFSKTDRDTNRDVMAALATGVPYAPYGAIVLSEDAASAVVVREGRLVNSQVIVAPDALGGMDLTA